MSFLRRVAGRSLRDRVRSSVTREELGVEPLLLRRIERSQLRWLGHLFRMPPGRLPREVFQACPTREEALGKTQDTLERLCLSAGLGTPRDPPWKSWRKCLGLKSHHHSLSLLAIFTGTPEVVAIVATDAIARLNHRVSAAQCP
ncbi:hypothetical protein L3Q82_000389 [Scortum barcoo]|uniref:Uncharacterized protein n=1 Tax=Scortum barcoo TaxID=214431 RepID=A0ACB8X9S8_9TELE|nr:hypothetical protein L3Q82_000389 [Scortum barcoo]